MGRAHEVAELAAGEGRHAVRMLARDQRVPQGAVRGRGDHLDRQVANPGRMRRDPGRFRNIGVKLARPVGHRRRPGRWQDNARDRVRQCRQRLHAAGNLEATGRVDKGEFRANTSAKGAAAVERLLRQDRGYARNCRFVPQGAADLGLCHGGVDITQRNRIVQSNPS